MGSTSGGCWMVRARTYPTGRRARQSCSRTFWPASPLMEAPVTSGGSLSTIRTAPTTTTTAARRGEDPIAVIRDAEVNFPMITIDRKSTLAAFKVGVSENLGGPGYYVEDPQPETSRRG